MPPRPLICPNCGQTLGIVQRYTDQRGRARQRVVLAQHIETRRHWFRLYVECACGELVRVPEDAEVVQRT